MAYNNRLNSSHCCKPCTAPVQPKTKEEKQEQVKPKVEPEVKEHSCCKSFKIVSITKVKDEVVVMFDDCTFLKTSMDVVNDNLKQDMSAGSNQSENDTDTGSLKEQVEELSNKYQHLLDSIIEIQDFSGNVRFKAVSADFTTRE